MRAVTGLVGRVNRDQYQITTPTATIGIRGTGGVIQVRDDGSTLIVGTNGIWSLTNPSGSIDVPAGVTALAPSTPDTPPQRTSQAPQAGPAPLILPVAYMEGEQRDANGNLTSIIKATIQVPPPPPEAETSISGLTVAFTYGVGTPAALGLDNAGGITGAFDASGRLVGADNGGSLYKLEAGGTHADFGTDGILTWGRWTGPVTLPGGPENYSANQGFHYVVGAPTPVLPTNNVTANYVLSGASHPTYLDGSTPPGTFTGSLSVNFGAQATINGQFRVDMQDRPNAPIAWTATGTTTSSNFSLGTTPLPGSCQTACAITTDGFFAGPTAERAGIGYSIVDGKTVVGAAAFRKQP
jgi:hypothetical protein